MLATYLKRLAAEGKQWATVRGVVSVVRFSEELGANSAKLHWLHKHVERTTTTRQTVSSLLVCMARNTPQPMEFIAVALAADTLCCLTLTSWRGRQYSPFCCTGAKAPAPSLRDFIYQSMWCKLRVRGILFRWCIAHCAASKKQFGMPSNIANFQTCTTCNVLVVWAMVHSS